MTEPIHKKHKANRSMRTHVTKEHNNQDTTNTSIEYKIINLKGVIYHKSTTNKGAIDVCVEEMKNASQA
jgi:hypothetical protein